MVRARRAPDPPDRLNPNDKSFGSANNYKRLEGSVTYATSWGAHTFNGTIRGGIDLNTGMPAYETFALGGPLQLPGYRIGEFSGREMAFGRLMYYNHAIKMPDILGSGVYLGGSLEAGRVTSRFDGLPSDNTKYSASRLWEFLQYNCNGAAKAWDGNDWDLYLPGYINHGSGTYLPEKLATLNSSAWGGGGFTATVTLKSSYSNYMVPVPILLPIAEVAWGRFSIMGLYVPRLSSNEGNGDVLLLWGRYAF